MFDLLQNVQPKFLTLTKRDRKKGQWDTGRDVRVGGEGKVVGAEWGVGKGGGGA